MAATCLTRSTAGTRVSREDLWLNPAEEEVFIQLQVRGHEVIAEVDRADHAVLMRRTTRGAHQAHRER